VPGTDELAFAARAERHRRELHVHCYRMLGSFEEAEDAVQEALLRAWRARAELERDEWFRAWLYRIATNTCLDQIRRAGRRVPSLGSFRDVPWLQPYPDHVLDAPAPEGEEPDAAVVGRETIELTFLAVMQRLPPRQRAVLILRQVLERPASEVAEILEMNVAGVNSALQRARATLREHLPADRREAWTAPGISAAEREVLDGFIAAHESGDTEAAMALIADDIRITMPPLPELHEGREAALALLRRAADRDAFGVWRLVPTGANRMPAAASYLRAPGEAVFRRFKLDVLRVEAGRIAEITTFGAALFPAFGLPDELPAA
jgi:RNA polymerase sigma-70 factor (ECF subfamily)